MESIVTQIVAKAVEKISAEMILELVSNVIEYVDKEFCDSKLRKELQLQVQQRNVERTVLLPIGELIFRRTVYKEKDTGEYVYPMDTVIGLNARDRISNELSARLIQKATSQSYEKSSEDVTGGKVTRQTVKNKVHEVGELAIESKREHRAIEQIDIYADEDHVEYVMDEFHIVNHLKRLCAGEIGKKYRLAIQTCIESDNKEGLIELRQRMLEDVKNYEKSEKKIKKEKKRIKEEIRYFINNWEAIEARKSGKVTAADVGKGRNEEFYIDKKGKRRRNEPTLPTNVKIYHEYAKEQSARIFDGNYDWSIFIKENMKNGKITGTSILLKAYGQAKAVG